MSDVGHHTTPRFKLMTLVCVEGHTYTTAFPSAFMGTPCPDCGKPLERVQADG